MCVHLHTLTKGTHHACCFYTPWYANSTHLGVKLHTEVCKGVSNEGVKFSIAAYFTHLYLHGNIHLSEEHIRLKNDTPFWNLHTFELHNLQ